MSETDERGFEQFEKFLEGWSRRDFLQRVGGAAAFTAFMGGGAAFLEACGGTTPAGKDTGKVVKGGKLIYSSISDIKNMNPVLQNDTASRLINDRIHDSLVTLDEQGTLVPLIAKAGPVVSDGGLTLTYKLNTNVTFTDGHPLTSDDVKFTYDLSFDPKYKDVLSQSRSTYEEYVQEFQAPDPATFVVKLKKVYAPIVTDFGKSGIVPKHVLANLSGKEINSADYNSNPTVTSGPFKFVEWKKGQQVTLAANEKYWRGRPNLDTFIYLVVGSTLDGLNKLQTGEVDIAGIDLSQADKAKTLTNIDLISFAGFSYDYIAFNIRDDKPAGKLFKDKAVRQAMLYAIDREAIKNAIYFGYATIADSVEPPLSWAFNKDVKTKYSFDKKKAESLLDGAGWVKGADGIRAKGGVKMSFEIITNAGNKNRENLILALSQAWKDVGMDAKTNFVDFNKVLVPALLNNRNFDVAMSGLSVGTDPDIDQYHTRNISPGNFNSPGYSSPQADKLIDDAVATLDKAKRKDLYFQLQNVLAEDPTQPPLFFAKGLTGISKRVKGYKFSPYLSTNSGARYFMKDVYVSDGK